MGWWWGVWIFSGTTHFVILYSSDSLVAILISTNSDDDLDAENVSTLRSDHGCSSVGWRYSPDKSLTSG